MVPWGRSKNIKQTAILIFLFRPHPSVTYINKRLTKKSGTNIFLLYHSKIPSVLVECGFLSNPSDLINLKNEKYRVKTALLNADGIIKYYKR